MKLIDVTVPIRDAMTVYRGNPPVRIRPAMTVRKDGVNLSELCLGSHTGTHVDAPNHFIKGGKGIDRVDLERFLGPAYVADLRRVKGGISAADLAKARIPGAPTHKRLLGAGIPILEGLDLFNVRPGRWQMAAFPLRIKDGDAGGTRAVLWNS